MSTISRKFVFFNSPVPRVHAFLPVVLAPFLLISQTALPPFAWNKVHGQETGSEVQAEVNVGPELAKFRELADAWRKTLVEVNAVTIRYRNSDDKEASKLREQHRLLEAEGRRQFDQLFDHALNITLSDPASDPEVTQFLLLATHYRYNHDIYERTGEAAEALIDIAEAGRGLPEITGVSYFATGQFEKARPFLEKAVQMGLLDEKNRGLLPALDFIGPLWDAEVEQLKADAEKNDLPRVKLTTTRGDVVVELFEDQAPNTVANFIRLVDEGAFRGIPFYQVIAAQVALAGDTRVTGDNLGFVISDENQGDDIRMAFRGYLSMAKLPMPEGSGLELRTIPNSASSHFFIAFRPLVDKKNEHTVFGRVIEGLNNVTVMTRVDPSQEKKEGEEVPDPDLILEAEVLRRRDHQYEPQRISTSPPSATAEEPKQSPAGN